AQASDIPLVAQTVEGSPSAVALNLPPGSRLTAVDGHEVSDWGDIVVAVAEFARAHPEGGELPVSYELAIADNPAGQDVLTVTAAQAAALASPQWQLPIPGHLYELMMTTVGATGPVDAAVLGVKKTHYFMKQTYITLARLIQGSVPFNQMRGPIGIAQI